MRPSLGLLLFADFSLAELARLGRLCEDLGYRSLWYTDIRFGRECYVSLAAVASVTTRLLLGPGVTDPYTRHPAITAATIATFDELSAGRALLGLGVGGQGFRELGIERKLPVAALRETVQTVRALLRGERVDVDGKVISVANGRLTFEPVREHIPIYFATHGAQVSKLAGKLADGVLIANTLMPRMLSFYLDRIREGMTSVGRSFEGFDFGLRVEVCISSDYDAAFALMRRRMAARLIGQYPHWDYLEALGVNLPPAFVEIAARKDETLAAEAASVMPPEVVEYTVLAGDAGRVAEQLARVMRPEVGSITVRPHAVAGEPVEEVVRAFAEDVMPRVEHLMGERMDVR
ncbi:MAG: LLM class flavin-dependent oxidoreductase [Gammaproteobacteria bacterium]